MEIYVGHKTIIDTIKTLLGIILQCKFEIYAVEYKVMNLRIRKLHPFAINYLKDTVLGMLPVLYLVSYLINSTAIRNKHHYHCSLVTNQNPDKREI